MRIVTSTLQKEINRAEMIITLAIMSSAKLRRSSLMELDK